MFIPVMAVMCFVFLFFPLLILTASFCFFQIPLCDVVFRHDCTLVVVELKLETIHLHSTWCSSDAQPF